MCVKCEELLLLNNFPTERKTEKTPLKLAFAKLNINQQFQLKHTNFETKKFICVKRT